MESQEDMCKKPSNLQLIKIVQNVTVISSNCVCTLLDTMRLGDLHNQVYQLITLDYCVVNLRQLLFESCFELRPKFLNGVEVAAVWRHAKMVEICFNELL